MAAAAGEAGSEEIISVSSYTAGPSGVAVSSALEVAIGFTANSAVEHAYWAFSYTVDSIKKRYTVLLGSTEIATLAPAAHEIKFACDSIDVSGIKPSRLANAGVLRAELRKAKSEGSKADDDDVLANVNAVVQVTEKEGAYVRTIFDPLG